MIAAGLGMAAAGDLVGSGALQGLKIVAAAVVALGDDTGSMHGLWLGMLVCISIAVLGTLTSLLVRRVAPAQRWRLLPPTDVFRRYYR